MSALAALTTLLRHTLCFPSAPVKLLIFVGLNIFGALGWWLGEPYGIMTAFLLSGAGSVLGVWLGWRAARQWLE